MSILTTTYTDRKINVHSFTSKDLKFSNSNTPLKYIEKQTQFFLLISGPESNEKYFITFRTSTRNTHIVTMEATFFVNNTNDDKFISIYAPPKIAGHFSAQYILCDEYDVVTNII